MNPNDEMRRDPEERGAPPADGGASAREAGGRGAGVHEPEATERRRERDSRSGEGRERQAPPPREPDTTPEAGAEPPAETVDYKDRWLRGEAEFQNFRRRAQREREESVRVAEDRLLLELIAAIDDLERAIEAAREAGAPDAWTQGVQMVVNRLVDDLARHGVRVMDVEGQPFDPRFHEALAEVEAPEGVAPGQVVRAVHTGYARGDRALRAARVLVAGSSSGRSA